jgi:hypothetical protein
LITPGVGKGSEEFPGSRIHRGISTLVSGRHFDVVV